MHDEYIQTRSGRRFPLENLTLDEMFELEKNEEIHCDHPGLRITRLEEALETADTLGSILNLDLKDDRSIASLCRAVERYGLLERTIVTGCDALRARMVKGVCPDLQVLLNISTKNVEGTIGEEGTVKTICSQAVAGCCCGINIDYRLCSERLVDYAGLRYLPVSVWTVDRPEDMRSMIAMGVYSITTYEPARLKKLIRRQCSTAVR
jgi:glycerophosphoryl diester phosphodiesterase